MPTGVWSLSAGKRANDNGGRPGDYELGDLQIVSSPRRSSVQPPNHAPVARGSQGMHAVAAHVGAPRTLTLDDDDEGPALELDTDYAARSAPISRPAFEAPTARGGPGVSRGVAPPARPAPPGARGVGPGSAPVLASAPTLELGPFEDDDDFENGFSDLPALEMEPVASRVQRAPVRETAPEDPRTKEQREAKLVADLADFGDRPSGWISCVRYAARVGSRLWKLRTGRELVMHDLAELGAHHHAALVAMGQQLIALSGDKRLEPLRGYLARVQEERSKLERAGASIAATCDENQRSMEQLAEKLALQEQQLAPFLAREKDAEAAQRKADEDQRRAQAMLKRGEIELRGLHDASVPDTARIEALTQKLEQRRSAMEGLGLAVARSNELLGRARREVALERGALDVLREQHKQLENASRAREAEAEGQRSAASGAHDLALRDLAEAARTQRLCALVPAAEQEVQDRAAPLQEANELLVRFDRALALYHRPSVYKGLALVAGIATSAVALLVLR